MASSKNKDQRQIVTGDVKQQNCDPHDGNQEAILRESVGWAVWASKCEAFGVPKIMVLSNKNIGNKNGVQIHIT